MRHDCVLATQLESLSERNYGAGTEESDTHEETRIAGIGKSKSLPLIYADNTDRKKSRPLPQRTQRNTEEERGINKTFLPQRTQRAQRKSAEKPQRTRRKKNLEEESSERSFEGAGLRRIGAQLNSRRSDQKEAKARRRETCHPKSLRRQEKTPPTTMGKRGAFG